MLQSEHPRIHPLSYFNYVDEQDVRLDYTHNKLAIIEQKIIKEISFCYDTPHGLVVEDYHVCDASHYNAVITVNNSAVMNNRGHLQHGYQIQIIDITTAQKKIITDLKESERLDEFWRHSFHSRNHALLLRKIR